MRRYPILLCVLMWVSAAVGGESSGSATGAVALETTEHAEARVALRLDIGSVPADARVDEVCLEGVLPGVPEDGSFWIEARRISETWSSDSVSEEPPVLDVVPVCRWEVTTLDYERLGGFVRLDLTGLVREWRESGPNHGIVLEAAGLDAEDLLVGLDQMSLRVLYSQ